MRHGISQIALWAGMALTAAGGALAQTGGVTELDTITVAASTEPVALSRTGATVSVVTQEDLRKDGDLSAAAYLARLPGVSLARTGGLGAQTAIRLRGLAGPYIGVRLDGIDVADPSGTQCAYDFGSTTTGGLSRIEVLRGSQSALYGSEAIAGVVDITSWRATKDGVSAEAGVEAGSANSYAATLSVGARGPRGELSFSASRTLTDGISSYAFGTEKDGFRSTFLSFYGAYDLTDAVRVGMNGFWRDSFAEFDSQTADNGETEEGRLRGLRAFVQARTGAVSHDLSVAETRTKRFYPLGYIQRYDGERQTLAYSGRWEAGGALSLNWGLDRTRETFAAGTDAASATTTALYAEALYAASPDLDLSFALRHDDHSVFGGKTSGRAALAWRPTDDWIVRAVASTGFRAPSLFELYSFYGNTALKPESSRTVELGAERVLSNGGSVQATLFHTQVDDLINFAAGRYNQVPGKTTLKGVELTGKAQVAPGWTVFGNYTYTDARTVNAGGVTSRLVRVPRHDLVMGVEGQLATGLTGILSVQHVADFRDNGIWPAPASKMPDYTVANATLTYEINPQAQAYLRVENLFDEQYQTVRNYGQPGRQVFLGVRTSF